MNGMGFRWAFSASDERIVAHSSKCWRLAPSGALFWMPAALSFQRCGIHSVEAAPSVAVCVLRLTRGVQRERHVLEGRLGPLAGERVAPGRNETNAGVNTISRCITGAFWRVRAYLRQEALSRGVSLRVSRQSMWQRACFGRGLPVHLDVVHLPLFGPRERMAVRPSRPLASSERAGMERGGRRRAHAYHQRGCIVLASTGHALALVVGTRTAVLVRTPRRTVHLMGRCGWAHSNMIQTVWPQVHS